MIPSDPHAPHRGVLAERIALTKSAAGPAGQPTTRPEIRAEGPAGASAVLPEAPPGSWVDVAPVRDSAPPTEPDAAPTPRLDPDLMGGACRRTLAAARHAIVGEPHQALAEARRAHELLGMAIGQYERAELVADLVADREPMHSAERDTREPEAVSP